VSPELDNEDKAINPCNAFTLIYINPQMVAN